MDLSGATLTIAYTTWRAMERELEELRRTAAAPAAAALPPETAAYRDALLDALQVVQFAVGNLNPESHRGWPHEALQRLGASLPALLPEEPDVTSLGLSLVQAAREAAGIDALRSERTVAAKKLLGLDETEANPVDSGSVA